MNNSKHPKTKMFLTHILAMLLGYFGVSITPEQQAVIVDKGAEVINGG